MCFDKNSAFGDTMRRCSRSVLAAAFVGVLALSACGAVLADEEEAAPDSVPNFQKMRVKELKKLLSERGVECVGCAEKDDLVKRVEETYVRITYFVSRLCHSHLYFRP